MANALRFRSSRSGLRRFGRDPFPGGGPRGRATPASTPTSLATAFSPSRVPRVSAATGYTRRTLWKLPRRPLPSQFKVFFFFWFGCVGAARPRALPAGNRRPRSPPTTLPPFYRWPPPRLLLSFAPAGVEDGGRAGRRAPLLRLPPALFYPTRVHHFLDRLFFPLKALGAGGAALLLSPPPPPSRPEPPGRPDRRGLEPLKGGRPAPLGFPAASLGRPLRHLGAFFFPRRLRPSSFFRLRRRRRYRWGRSGPLRLLRRLAGEVLLGRRRRPGPFPAKEQA